MAEMASAYAVRLYQEFGCSSGAFRSRMGSSDVSDPSTENYIREYEVIEDE